MAYDMFGRTPEQAERDRQRFWDDLVIAGVILLILYILAAIGY